MVYFHFFTFFPSQNVSSAAGPRGDLQSRENKEHSRFIALGKACGGFSGVFFGSFLILIVEMRESPSRSTPAVLAMAFSKLEHAWEDPA